MISIKIYEQGDDLVIGACDEHLLGKKFVDGKLQIDVSENFYGGQCISEKTLAKYLLDALIYSLVVAGSFAWLWPS